MKNCVESIKNSCVDWWYENDDVFLIQFLIDLSGINISLRLFTLKASIKLLLPYWEIYFHDLGCIHKRLTEHKSFELQLTFTSDGTTGIKFYQNIHCHHAGTGIELSILGLTLSSGIYDRRHWDEDNNQFVNYWQK